VRHAFLKIERGTTALATALACAMLVVASSLGMWQIITRFILERPAEWTEVLIRFSLIWMVFLGIPQAFRLGAMVSVDVLYRWSGARTRRFLDAMVAIAALVLLAVTIIVGWDYAQRGRVQFGVEDGRELVSQFPTGKAAIHQNHGLFTVGQTVDEAAFWFLSMDRSCQAQLLAMAAGTPQRIPHEDAAYTREQTAHPIAGWLSFQPLWQEICRTDPDLFE
jgi:hypothetical protein